MVKKINGKKAKKTVNKFEIKKIRKLIKQELYSNYTMGKLNQQKTVFNPLDFQNKPEDNQKEYYMKYTKYMSEQFNSTIVNMLIIYIKQSKTFPSSYQTEPNFFNKLVNFVKRLFMNELELSFFTILLDKLGWAHQGLNHWTYFCILGILAKKLLGNEEESSLLISFFTSKNYDFLDEYTIINDEEIIKNYEEQPVCIKKINERFRQLTRPINSYCRHNFINYNGVVDKIVKWSQPYGAESNGNQLNNDEFFLSNNNNEEKIFEMPTVKEGKIMENYDSNYANNRTLMNNNSNNFYNSHLQSLQSNDFIDQGRNFMNDNNPGMSLLMMMNEMNYPNNYLYSNLNLMNKTSSQYSFRSRKNE